jgi:nucleoside-diphosphate-sugar epimerase
MQTILGAGGGIGTALAYELLKNKKPVRLVSRSRFSIPGAEAVKGDVTDYNQTLQSTANSEVVYLCVGLKYDTKVWSTLWDKILQNTINACKKNNAKLIFVDNVYMYGKVEGPMTESTPYKPDSVKGEIRARLARKLEAEYKKGNIDASIARAADIYGPYGEKTSFVNIMIIDKILNGKKAMLMLNDHIPHSLTYTIDCGRALYLLGDTPESFNQVWHLPTYNPPPTGKELAAIVSDESGIQKGYSVLSRGMLKMFGLFNTNVKESIEMLYQYENEYIFSSDKFNAFFNYIPSDYREGIRRTIEYLSQQRT